MRARRSINEVEEVSEINVSPLIDMVFILLIFFIVTTVFVEETEWKSTSLSLLLRSLLKKTAFYLR